MNNERSRLILEQRAELLSKELVDEFRVGSEVEAVFCTARAETFAFPVAYLREIVPLPPLTRLPFAPAWCLGLAQVRGNLLVALDLATFCQATGKSEMKHLAVVEGTEGLIGICVDEILGCREISTAKLSTSGELGDRRATLGVTSDLAVVLDLPRLLSLPEIVIE
jgi:chemotaxis signal transduction protein